MDQTPDFAVLLGASPFRATAYIPSEDNVGITVTCSNGHQLVVKDKYAGKTGYCPHCQIRVRVPEKSPEPELAEEILALLEGGAAGDSRSSHSVLDGPRPGDRDSASGLSLLGSSFVKRKRACPQCGFEASQAFTHCPRCSSPLTPP